MKLLSKIVLLTYVLLFSTFLVNYEATEISVKADTKITYKNVNANKYVNSKGGLILRSTADSKGKKVTMLKDGSKVFVYSTSSNGWSYVKQGNYKGYVKDSYLKATNKNQTTQKKRVIDFTMNVNQVKAMEPAKLKSQISDSELTVLTYNVNKYGYPSELKYYFQKGKLIFIVYDFLPQKNNYNTWNEMVSIFNLLDKQAVKEFGSGRFTTDNLYFMSKRWDRKNYSIMLRVDDSNVYTKAQLSITNLINN